MAANGSCDVKTIRSSASCIRMLDNDLIRLNQKVNTVLHLRGKTIEHERVEAERVINQRNGEHMHDAGKKPPESNQ